MLSALDRRFAGPYTFIVPNGTSNSSEEITMSRTTHEGPLAGKVALVTGGFRGPRAALARAPPPRGPAPAATSSPSAHAAGVGGLDKTTGGGTGEVVLRGRPP